MFLSYASYTNQYYGMHSNYTSWYFVDIFSDKSSYWVLMHSLCLEANFYQ